MTPQRKLTDPRERIRELLLGLEAVLRSQDEKTWILGIRGAIQVIDDANLDETSQQAAIDWVRAAYREMAIPKEGFGDYNIWREDLTARVEANRELDLLRDELWNVLMESDGGRRLRS